VTRNGIANERQNPDMSRIGGLSTISSSAMSLLIGSMREGNVACLTGDSVSHPQQWRSTGPPWRVVTGQCRVLHPQT